MFEASQPIPINTGPDTNSGEEEVSDDELIVRAGSGDDAAWTALVHRHLRPVYGHAWYLLNDAAEAEDVAQETLLRLMKKSASWQPGGAKLKTWLFRVAINLCKDRRRASRPAPFADAVDDGPGLDPALDIALDQARLVRDALGQLTDKQRAAVTLVHYQGFSNPEAAEILELSVEALESLLSRARRALKEHLRPALPDLLGEDR
ncbi:MAG: sigma-70 family RNA polymerase sigma factor [Rhodospirillales bacterium]|nr:sigma-70 family RNA polymerase sigma factor [Rhodospirillales bacterium]